MLNESIASELNPPPEAKSKGSTAWLQHPATDPQLVSLIDDAGLSCHGGWLVDKLYLEVYQFFASQRQVPRRVPIWKQISADLTSPSAIVWLMGLVPLVGGIYFNDIWGIVFGALVLSMMLHGFVRLCMSYRSGVVQEGIAVRVNESHGFFAKGQATVTVRLCEPNKVPERQVVLPVHLSRYLIDRDGGFRVQLVVHPLHKLTLAIGIQQKIS